jgi:hypothetical protein
MEVLSIGNEEFHYHLKSSADGAMDAVSFDKV